METHDEKLLEIKDLHLHFDTYAGTVQALRGVNLVIHRGETLGLVGESGSGKSQTVMALLQPTPMPPGKFTQGEMLCRRKLGEGGESQLLNIFRLPKGELRRIRGN